jgi:hypothetical protein
MYILLKEEHLKGVLLGLILILFNFGNKEKEK